MPIINSTRAGLPAPLIHDVENNGGLGVREIGEGAVAPVTVIVGPWDLFKDGDQVRILWGGPGGPVVAERDMRASDADKPVPVLVQPADIRALGDGTFAVYTQVVAAIGDPILSPPLSVRVKTTRPGGIDTQPDTETINENLARAQVRPNPLGDDLGNVRVVIARYENIATGDRIRVSWHGQFVDLPPLAAGDTGRPEFEVPIPEAAIRAAGGGDVQITYRILDVVSNNSLWAPYYVVDVPIDDPEAPQSPWVEKTLNDDGAVLRLADLANGPVTVLAESHGGRRGERIRVHWAGVAAGEQAVPPYDTAWQEVTRDNGTLIFTVPFDQAQLLGEGRVTVTYTLERANGSVATSRRRNLAIQGKAVGLALPMVEDTPGNVLDAAKHTRGAIMLAPRQPERIPAGSHVTFRWEGAVRGSAEAYADGVTDTLAVLPYEQILALVGGPVRIQYVVETFSANTDILAISESGWLTLDVIDSAATPGLAPPYVPEAVNDILDPDALLAHLAIPALARGTEVKATIQARVPFTQTLPIGDPAHPPSFTLSGAGFIKPNDGSEASATYVVTAPGYSATSTPYAFRIGQAQGALPAPTVKETGGTDTLLPAAAQNGATVQVPATLSPGDRVVVHFGDYNSPAVNWSANLEVVVPPGDVAKTLGKIIDVAYTVNGEGMSPVLRLHVLDFDDGDSHLPQPAIVQAKGSVVDLGTFTGNATVTVAPWPLIAVGQTVWLRITGTLANGNADNIELLNGDLVTAAMVNSGVRHAVPRNRLESLKDASPLTVECLVSFSANGESTATAFPRRRYTIEKTPRIYKEDFESLAHGFYPELDLSLLFIKSNDINRPLHITDQFQSYPVITGNYLDLDGRSVSDMTFKVHARKLAFGMLGGSGWIVLMLDDGMHVEVPCQGAFSYTAPIGRYVVAMNVAHRDATRASLDNFELTV